MKNTTHLVFEDLYPTFISDINPPWLNLKFKGNGSDHYSPLSRHDSGGLTQRFTNKKITKTAKHLKET